jgi:hypothetical protein
MTVLRTDIEKALDELISNEEGMRFQGLAVVLAKQKWPDLIASERKKDLGLDAHAPALLARGDKGRGLACSLTATLEKIKDDVEKIRRDADDVKVLVFATPRSVTKYTAIKWADAVREKYGIELIVIPREDIITDLMVPSNASICRTHLGIPVAVEPGLEELLEKAREAISEVVAAWLAHPRLAGRPKIALQTIKLDQEGRETGEVIDLASLQAALREGRRIVLEAPAGRGKTTTLIQLAERHGDRDELAFLVDLPTWITSNIDLLEFIASMPAFRSRGVHAEDLARLYGSLHCTFLLNGWNEVSDSYSENAVLALAHLERNFPQAGIIVATRTHHIRPPLPGSFRTRLLPLSRRQRAEYLEQALSSRAEELGALIDGERVLDDLTRTPMILAEVTTIFLSGVPIPKTKVGVLAAVMRLLEQADEHRNYLERLPLTGYSRDYLAELAAQMMTQGDVTVGEERARSNVYSVSLRLNADGQIATLPEPAMILNTLCAHHVLERLEYPSVAFRFEHQQFQEFYAALLLKRQLWDFLGKDDRDGNRSFAREYVNKPIWAEPFRMIAEEIGELSGESSSRTDAMAVGKRLIQLALLVDPIFAAELSRLCGPVVWEEVRIAVSERLRAWYEVVDEHHRRCALAGMLATGSDEFIDILLPLLTNDDDQVRLKAYRAWGEFYVTSLGREWRHVVRGWKEEQRADFIGEVVGERWMADVAEEFARTDSSPRVRAAVLHALQWIDASETLSRVLTVFDDETFENLLRDRVIDTIPVGLKPRALLTYEKLLQKADDPRERLRIRLAAAAVGADQNLEGVMEDLSKWPSEKVADTDQWLLKSALEIMRKTDPQWVSHWTAGRIVDGFLWADRWITFVSSIPEALKRELLERISDKAVEETDNRGAVSVFAATADTDLAADVFSRLCTLRAEISTAGGEPAQSLWKVSGRLQDLFRTISPNVAVSGMLSRLSPEFNGTEYDLVIDLFGRIGGEDSDLRSLIEEDHRQRLRKYLKEGLPFALNQDDFNGHLKAHLALALARVGEPDDMHDVHRLIRADIDRLRRGRAALLRGERGPLTNGATMWWTNWYVRAVSWLDPKRAEETFLDLLCEPEYEQEATTALIQLARIQSPEKQLGLNRPDYSLVWDARLGRRATQFDEDRRFRYATAIKKRLSTLMEDRSKSDDPDSFNRRLKELAKRLAVIDGCNSAEFMEIMMLPSQWDEWTRAEALEALLFSGARLGAQESLKVLNPAIEYALSHSYEQQAAYLLQRCLCFLPFVDPPSTGIARIKEVIAATRVLDYELREVVTALGYSRSNVAFELLLELATAGGNGFNAIAGEWIEALAALDTPESKRVLLSFVDPDIAQLGVEQHFESHNRERLASHIVDIARAQSTVRERLYLLCNRELSQSTRLLLAEVITGLSTPDAAIAGLNLIHDDASPPIPFSLTPLHENAFFEHRPYGTGGSYTRIPRSATEIRRRLFEMVLNDNTRRRSAWRFLGQIESWRLDYGRPNSEPRHPAFESGEPWPPINAAVGLGITH